MLEAVQKCQPRGESPPGPRELGRWRGRYGSLRAPGSCGVGLGSEQDVGTALGISGRDGSSAGNKMLTNVLEGWQVGIQGWKPVPAPLLCPLLVGAARGSTTAAGPGPSPPSIISIGHLGLLYASVKLHL